jgi:NAD(P)-dependent dehydrogenase (short-subunit alcohol dehydrogenase family)
VSPDTTTADVLEGVDLTGKTALVTGASAGLGVETVRALRSVGAEVVGAVRDLDKGRAALGADVDLVELDLADLDSVRRGAGEISSRLPDLDLLINNAGVMAPPLMRTKQGFELQLGTNHLGHFVLTNALLPTLGVGSRIINLSSRGHLRSPMRWDDPHFRDESTYEKWTAYGQSKTANILFTVELEKRLADKGIHAHALHPGVIMTELSRHLTADDQTALAKRLPAAGFTFKQVDAGAATTVWAATSKELEGTGGLYLEDCHVAGVTPGDGSAGYASYAMDPDEAARLWTWSDEQTT